jgi:hypothetical protein
MGLQLPTALTEPLSWIGLIWPEADEDLLLRAGEQWIAYGTQLQRIAEHADQAASQVWSQNQGAAVDAFHQWWDRTDGPRRRLAEDAVAASIIGAALVAFAAVTLAMKIAFIVQLTILVIEVAQAIATAVATFGATAAEVPGFIAATRAICRQIVRTVVTHVQTVIRDLLRKARNLLKRVDVRAGRGVRGLVGRSDLKPDGLAWAHRLPDDLRDDLRRVNPHHDPADPRWSTNCTHCASAFELRRRGLDAEALPIPQRLVDAKKFGRPIAMVEKIWGMKLRPSSYGDIVDELAKAGPGSRGFVTINLNRGGGHIFNAENVGGRVHFLDAQNGDRDVSNLFNVGSGVGFVRTDTLPAPTNGIDEFAKINS